MHKTVVVHAVFPMETDGRLIMCLENVDGIYCGILITKQSPYPTLLLLSHTTKALLRHLLVGLHQLFSHHKLLYTILSGVLELLLSRHPMGLHRLIHLEGWIYDDTIVAIQHLCIHTTHRCTDDQVGLFLIAGLT